VKRPVALPQLLEHSDCRKCDLHKGCTHVGLRTRWDPNSLRPGKHPALVCVGASPGHQEDRYGEVWAGPAGDILRGVYMKSLDVWDRVSIYYANIVRCHSGLGDPKPSKKQIKACIPYLYEDLEWIDSKHSELVLLVMGGPACQAMFGMTMTTSSRRLNGRCVSVPFQEKA
jgi:uracil-DNA glycosylase family 4